MTNRGLFGLPQGQQSRAATPASLPFNVLSRAQPENVRAFQAVAMPVASTYIQVVGATTEPLILYQALINYNFGGPNVRIAIGAAGSERDVVYQRTIQLGSNFQHRLMVFDEGVVVPSGSRISIRFEPAASGVSTTDGWVALYAYSTQGVQGLVLPARTEGLLVTRVFASQAGTWVVAGQAPEDRMVTQVSVADTCPVTSNVTWNLGISASGSVPPTTGVFPSNLPGYPQVATESGEFGGGSWPSPSIRIPPLSWPRNSWLWVWRNQVSWDYQGVHVYWRNVA